MTDWGNWTLSGDCPVTCGGSKVTRSRQCLNVAADGIVLDDKECKGKATEEVTCNDLPCPGTT